MQVQHFIRHEEQGVIFLLCFLNTERKVDTVAVITASVVSELHGLDFKY